MKIILSGDRNTKEILPICSYLASKYLKDFDLYYLNFGDYDGKLFYGSYVNLGNNQGDVSQWSEHIRNYLNQLTDRLIIFALDDHLVSRPINVFWYTAVFVKFLEYRDVVCGRLCTNDFYRLNEYDKISPGVIQLRDNVEYSATTQYSIWNRKYLVDLLSKTTTPWNFEIEGSKILNASGKKVVGAIKAPFEYYDPGALSRHYNGKIHLDKLSKKDINYLVRNNYIDKERIYK